MEQTIATAVNKEPFSFKKMLMNCLPVKNQQRNRDGNMTNDSPISAVRLQITVNDVKGCRKIYLKGLYGDSELLKSFIAQFRIKLHSLVKNVEKDGSTSRSKRRPSGTGMPTHPTQHDDSDEESELRVGKYTETSSVY